MEEKKSCDVQGHSWHPIMRTIGYECLCCKRKVDGSEQPPRRDVFTLKAKNQEPLRQRTGSGIHEKCGGRIVNSKRERCD